MITKAMMAGAARAAHECLRSFCLANDEPRAVWEEASEEQVRSMIEGVSHVIAGKKPPELHQAWMDWKVKEGWTYGPEKDETLKRHPCLVDYADLPAKQKIKDMIFHRTVMTMLYALGAEATDFPPEAMNVRVGTHRLEPLVYFSVGDERTFVHVTQAAEIRSALDRAIGEVKSRKGGSEPS